MRRRRGFFIADAIAGLLIVSVVIGSLAVAMSGARKVSQRSAELRRAVELAERSAIELQATGASTLANVTTRPLASTPDGTWTEILATVNQRTATLVVLVPAERGATP